MTATHSPTVTDGRVPAPLPGGLTMPPIHERWMEDCGRCKYRELRIPLPIEDAFLAWWTHHNSAAYMRGFYTRRENGAWILCQRLVVLADGRHTLAQRELDRIRSLKLRLPAPEPELVLPPLPGDLEGKLFEYQIPSARQLFRALKEGPKEWGFSGAWCCDEMGTGKTYTSLAAAIATGKDVIVVCPKSVTTAWRNAAKHFGFQLLWDPINYEALKGGRREDKLRIESVIMPSGRKAKVYRWQADPEQTVLIFDEAHMMKNAGTKNQKMGLAAVEQGFSILCLSGTLATFPTHLRFAGRVVGLHKGGEDYYRFLHDHGCVFSGGEWVPPWGAYGRRCLAKIHKSVFPQRGSRIRIADLGDKFPETQILCEAYDSPDSNKINKAFQEAQKIVERLRKQGEPEERIKMAERAAYMDAWHQSERLKVPAIVELAKREEEEGRSVAIFCNFTDVREALMAALKTNCAIFGGQNGKARDEAIAAFQEDTSHYIVANISAGGVGVSLHDVRGERPRTAIILPTNQVVSLSQALGRVHRAGGKSKSRQIVFFAADTIEEEICKSIRAKIANLAALNDGDLNPPPAF